MADTTPKPGPSDATDNSSTTAPETGKEAEERRSHPRDSRLQPGGAHGSPADPGMSSLGDNGGQILFLAGLSLF